MDDSPTRQSDHYKLYGDQWCTPVPLPDEISFTNHNHPPSAQANTPLPSKKYLSIHAMCCKVAIMSGAKGYLEQVMTDHESLNVLSSDGSSADVFVNAVFKAYYDRSEELRRCQRGVEHVDVGEDNHR